MLKRPDLSHSALLCNQVMKEAVQMYDKMCQINEYGGQSIEPGNGNNLIKVWKRSRRLPHGIRVKDMKHQLPLSLIQQKEASLRA